MTPPRLSVSSKYVYSAIRESDDLAEQLRRKGKKVTKLSSGDPPVYFPTPKYVLDAYVDALRSGKTSYSRSQGVDELVGVIIKRYRSRYGLQLGEQDVLVTSGVSEALNFVNRALVDPGDTAGLLKPYYPPYPVSVRMFGGEPLSGVYDESRGWSVDLDGLARLLQRNSSNQHRTKYMLITNPNNPTGTVLSRKSLSAIADLANEYNILLISDEIYDEILFDGPDFASVSQVASDIPHVILNGASKAFDATGFRIGYVLVPGRDRLSTALKSKLADYCRVRLCASTPAEYAIAQAMSNTTEHEKAVREMVKSIRKTVESAMKLLNENPHLTTVRPQGAFYVFPRIDLRSLKMKNDAEFVTALLREKLIQTTRGSGFGSPSHFRIVALAPEDIMTDCIEEINAFCREHSR